MNGDHNHTEWRAFWRLIFDVIECVPRMQQEITIWEAQGAWPSTGLRRLAYEIKTLVPTQEVNVEREHSRVKMTNGFLEYMTDVDTDIRNLVAAAGLPAPELLEGISEPVGGENIYIRADISLIEPVEGDNPIFFFPQMEPSGVQLAEIYDSSEDLRRIKWAISNQFYRSQGFFRLDPDEYEGRHGLRVRQSKEVRHELFDFYVDTLPLDVRYTQPTHSFLPGLQTFYLGKTPFHPDNFTGAIYHLTFDPNNSCVRCPQPTAIEPEQD